jgi:hypothetical protein
MTWKCGDSKIITCSNASTIEEVAQEHGFMLKGDISPVFISRGQILAPEFTLHKHNIQNGQNIIVYMPARAKKRPSPVLTPLALSNFSPMFEFDTLEAIEAEEAAKTADQDFANWETSRSFPALLKEMMTLMEKEEKLYTWAERTEKTVIEPGTQISETPLPELITHDSYWLRASGLTFCNLP